MKKLYTLFLGTLMAVLCCFNVVAQDEGNIEIKITKDIDGERKTFEGTYKNREEMESDPKYKEFVGDDHNFHFNFNGTNGFIEIEEMINDQIHSFRFHDDDGDDNGHFFFHSLDFEHERLQSRLKDQLRDLEVRIEDFNADLLEEGYMDRLMEMVDELETQKNLMISKRHKIHITEVGEDEFGKKGNVRSSELLQLDELNFYPNPSNGRFKLKFKTPEEGKLEISVYDLEGSRVFNSAFERFNGWYQEHIDLSSRDKGIYLLEIKLNQKRLTKKIVID